MKIFDQGATGDAGYQLEKHCTPAPCAEEFLAATAVGEGAVVGASSSEKQPDFSDPVYRKLSRMNGEINRMHKEQLRHKLSELHLHTGYAFFLLLFAFLTFCCPN